MNPTKRLEIIKAIALKLQAEHNTTAINILLSGYGIEIDNKSIVYSKKEYVIDLLKSQSNNIVEKIAIDLEIIAEKSIKTEIKTNNQINMNKKIFISHSSLDIDVVEKIIDTLEAIGLSNEQIFCSSFEGYGVKLGDDFLETIKNELNSNVLVLFVLSSNFYSSPVSLCEMGATWVKTNNHIPILIPPFEYSQIKGVIPTTHGMKINEKNKFNSLKEAVETFFNLTQINNSVWERKRDNILTEIDTVIKKRKDNEDPNEIINNIKNDVFEVGDVVQLKSGGQIMTIENIVGVTTDKTQTFAYKNVMHRSDGDIICKWQVNNEFKTEVFEPKIMKKIQ